MKSKVYKRKVDARDELFADTLGAALYVKKLMISLDGKHPNFSDEMPNALWLTVGF
jgi:hypothetical protein